jgi:tetratricopeptide (TPR) repeat protein
MTRHADPLRSLEAASRHFFRHIHNLRELRRNPIFARLALHEATSESGVVAERLLLDGVRSRVTEALERVTSGLLGHLNAERAHRYNVIVKEHILGRRSAHDVAGELHLSLREFYRQKRAACTILATTMSGEPSDQAKSLASVRLDGGQLALDQARLFMEGSKFGLSRSTLEDVIRDGSSDDRRAEALCLLAEAFIQQGSSAAAESALERARRAVAEAGAFDDGSLNAQLTVAESLLAMSNCDFVKARTLIASATAQLQPLLGTGNERATSTYARAMVNAGFTLVKSGDYRGSLASFQRALAAAEGLRFETPIRATALYGMASTAVTIGNTGVEEYHKLTGPILDLAQRNGFVRTAVAIAINRALFDACKGSGYDSALKELAECWRISVRTDDRRLVTEVGLTLAALHVNVAGAGQRANGLACWKNALDVLQRTEELGLLDDFTSAHVYSMKAQAYLGMMRFPEAFAMAQKAKGNAERLGNRRIRATSLRVIAESCWARGKIAEASRTASEAVALLEADGHLLSLAAAYRTSAKITGNPKHRRLAASTSVRA